MKYERVATSRESFQKILNTGSPVLLLYHAKWCPHCIMFMNEWKKTALSLSKKKIYTLKIEHSILDKLPLKYRNIYGFPTIVLIHNKKRIEYIGNRSSDDIIDFVTKKVV